MKMEISVSVARNVEYWRRSLLGTPLNAHLHDEGFNPLRFQLYLRIRMIRPTTTFQRDPDDMPRWVLDIALANAASG